MSQLPKNQDYSGDYLCWYLQHWQDTQHSIQQVLCGFPGTAEPQTGVLKTTETYSLTILKARRPEFQDLGAGSAGSFWRL